MFEGKQRGGRRAASGGGRTAQRSRQERTLERRRRLCLLLDVSSAALLLLFRVGCTSMQQQQQAQEASSASFCERPPSRHARLCAATGGSIGSRPRVRSVTHDNNERLRCRAAAKRRCFEGQNSKGRQPIRPRHKTSRSLHRAANPPSQTCKLPVGMKRYD